MFSHLLYLLLICSAHSRHIPKFSDLDEEDHHLFRAAYDTPSYEQDEYEEPHELSKLDLLWVIKSKLKELKAFNKAMAANLLSTKLKVKELLSKKLEIKKPPKIIEIVEKPAYSYQGPAYTHDHPAHYSAPYNPPQPQYSPPQPQYSPPQPQYSPPQPQYAAPQYDAPHDPYYGH